MKGKKVYINNKQEVFLQSYKPVQVLIGGRGFGKSTVIGDITNEAVHTMPRASWFIASDTIKRIENFSLPEVIGRWETLGLIEGEDYVIFKTPPRYFDKPYSRPTNYNNVITFSNGFSLEAIGLYRTNSGRGGNYQGGIVDEARLVDHAKLTRDLLPTMRGNLHKIAKVPIDQPFSPPYGYIQETEKGYFWIIPFKENPRYLGLYLFSNMPYTSSGNWLLDYENDPEALYMEGTAWDNIDVLGEAYIRKQKRMLPPHIYAVEVENRRLVKQPGGFYEAFDDSIHTQATDLYNPYKKLLLSFDFNAGFNSMVIAQDFPPICYVMDELYVEGNRLVDDLVNDFADRYKDHKIKEVEIYGDRNGNARRPNSPRTLYQDIEAKLQERGWRYYRPHKGLDAEHREKQQALTRVFREDSLDGLPIIRINRLNCPGLIISLRSTLMTFDGKKDKRSERSKTIPRNEATDLTDCFDNLIMFRFKNQLQGRRGTGGAGDSSEGIGDLISF